MGEVLWGSVIAPACRAAELLASRRERVCPTRCVSCWLVLLSCCGRVVGGRTGGFSFDLKGWGVAERPEIVCICGSARFVDEMHAANRELTFAGVIVVAPGVFPSGEANEVVTDEQKSALGALHLRKIDLADRVLVVNPGGYIGESTSREIAYARATGKPVSYTDPV